MATNLSGKKILVTGPTGQVALPVTLALAKENDVVGVARFRDAGGAEPARGRGRHLRRARPLDDGLLGAARRTSTTC